jgi:hypothetical protein
MCTDPFFVKNVLVDRRPESWDFGKQLLSSATGYSSRTIREDFHGTSGKEREAEALCPPLGTIQAMAD